MRAMEGWVIERAPFRGNGFAPGESSDVIAEFKVDSVRLPHGAQLWRIGADGNEQLVATLDATARLAAGRGASDARRLRGPLAGREYEASPDGDHVRLYRAEPADGFDRGPARAGMSGWCRPTRSTNSCYVRTTCTWRGQPFIVLGEHDGWLRVEYTGGRPRWPRRWAWRSSTSASTRAGRRRPRSTDLREHRV